LTSAVPASSTFSRGSSLAQSLWPIPRLMSRVSGSTRSTHPALEADRAAQLGDRLAPHGVEVGGRIGERLDALPATCPRSLAPHGGRVRRRRAGAQSQ
jgi:hypothetical protein